MRWLGRQATDPRWRKELSLGGVTTSSLGLIIDAAGKYQPRGAPARRTCKLPGTSNCRVLRSWTSHPGRDRLQTGTGNLYDLGAPIATDAGMGGARAVAVDWLDRLMVSVRRPYRQGEPRVAWPEQDRRKWGQSAREALTELGRRLQHRHDVLTIGASDSTVDHGVGACASSGTFQFAGW